jgi:release factor glutamine methyltransferase
VRDMEKKQMDKNVLEWEPDNALFVSDEDPLIFYRKIVEFAKKYLDNNGLLFFEINEHFGKQMYELMVLKDFTNIELRKDINGKDRMICGKKR